MNAIAEKLQAAGADTLGARLTTACIEAVRVHPDSTVDAWRYVGAVFGHEFVRGLMNDMQPKGPAKELRPAPSPPSRETRVMASSGGWMSGKPRVMPPAPYKPRAIPPERRELERVVRSKYKNSGGVAWSDVSCHEALALMRDGKEVEALLAACPTNLPNDGKTFGDLLGVKRVDEIIESVRNMPSQ